MPIKDILLLLYHMYWGWVYLHSSKYWGTYVGNLNQKNPNSPRWLEYLDSTGKHVFEVMNYAENLFNSSLYFFPWAFHKYNLWVKYKGIEMCVRDVDFFYIYGLLFELPPNFLWDIVVLYILCIHCHLFIFFGMVSDICCTLWETAFILKKITGQSQKR